MSLANHYVCLAKHAYKRAMHYRINDNMNSAIRYMVQRDYFLERARGL